jgi:purine-nucleoside phosphorylase
MARHCDLKVFAFSLITNKCETDYEGTEDVNHEDVTSIGLRNQAKITKFVLRMVEKINELIVKEEERIKNRK